MNDDIIQLDRTRPTLADRLGIVVPDWYSQALCAQTDPEGFYPDKGGSTREVKRICNGNAQRSTEPCPVREQCLEYAIANDERWGVWGGVSERDRRKIKKERGAAA